MNTPPDHLLPVAAPVSHDFVARWTSAMMLNEPLKLEFFFANSYEVRMGV